MGEPDASTVFGLPTPRPTGAASATFYSWGVVDSGGHGTLIGGISRTLEPGWAVPWHAARSRARPAASASTGSCRLAEPVEQAASSTVRLGSHHLPRPSKESLM